VSAARLAAAGSGKKPILIRSADSRGFTCCFMLRATHMKARRLPVGITVSRTEPWFRYSRGQHVKPTYFYYGAGGQTKARARAAAIAHALRENAKWTPRIEAARKGRKTKSNTSGAVGVSIKTEKGRSRGSVYRYWWARWPGCPSGVKFSILEHGKARAFALAQIARELETQDKAAIERAYVRRGKRRR
jgi:hypothetical protein